MARIAAAFAAALLLAGVAGTPAHANETLYTADLLGNVANQVIAGFPSSTATWTIKKGRVTLAGFGKNHAILILKAKGLIIPALGFNPSPDVLARVVCHDATGKPFEGARTKTAPLDPGRRRDADRRGPAAGPVLRADHPRHGVPGPGGEPARQLVRGLGPLGAGPRRCNPLHRLAS
jgi:hypothetical protein